MERKDFEALKVGDRLENGDRVASTKYQKQGAIQIEVDLPHRIRAIENALDNYRASYYDDIHGPGSYDRELRPWRASWRLVLP